MESKVLEKFGLTSGESKVYLALLKIGKSTIGDIIRESKVSSSKAYEILERLQKKGLVGAILENNRRCFEAKDPSRFKEVILEDEMKLQEKKKNLGEMLPTLKSIYERSKVRQGAEILQGIKGLMTWHDEIIDECKRGDTISVISPTQANEKMDSRLLDWHAKRIKKGIKCRLLYNQDANEWARGRKNIDMLEYRFLPKNVKSPVGLNITNKSVATTVFGEDILVFIIKNSDIADNYKTYFDLLWDISKK